MNIYRAIIDRCLARNGGVNASASSSDPFHCKQIGAISQFEAGCNQNIAVSSGKLWCSDSSFWSKEERINIPSLDGEWISGIADQTPAGRCGSRRSFGARCLEADRGTVRRCCRNNCRTGPHIVDLENVSVTHFFAKGYGNSGRIGGGSGRLCSTGRKHLIIIGGIASKGIRRSSVTFQRRTRRSGLSPRCLETDGRTIRCRCRNDCRTGTHVVDLEDVSIGYLLAKGHRNNRRIRGSRCWPRGAICKHFVIICRIATKRIRRCSVASQGRFGNNGLISSGLEADRCTIHSSSGNDRRTSTNIVDLEDLSIGYLLAKGHRNDRRIGRSRGRLNNTVRKYFVIINRIITKCIRRSVTGQFRT